MWRGCPRAELAGCVEILTGQKLAEFRKPVYCIKLQVFVRRPLPIGHGQVKKRSKLVGQRKRMWLLRWRWRWPMAIGIARTTPTAAARHCYATKSSGRLKPPLRFMYWRYFRLRITCTSPTSLPSTFLFLVVSNVQNPIVFSISTSSGDLPSRSASLILGRSAAVAAALFLVVLRDVDGPELLLPPLLPPPPPPPPPPATLDRDLDRRLRARSRSRSRSRSRLRLRSRSRSRSRRPAPPDPDPPAGATPMASRSRERRSLRFFRSDRSFSRLLCAGEAGLRLRPMAPFRSLLVWRFE